MIPTANFGVDVEANGPVTAGEDLPIDTTITNDGSTEQTQESPIRVNGTIVDTQSVTLGPDDSQTISTACSTSEDTNQFLTVAKQSYGLDPPD